MTEAFGSERSWSNKTIKHVSIEMNQAPAATIPPPSRSLKSKTISLAETGQGLSLAINTKESFS
ncbi:hypothetical protein [Mesorhizobium sp.]|nr:hypothetical protein [Mesorhizobium sp.]